MFLDHRCAHVVLDHLPDAIHISPELGCALELERTRPRQLDLDVLLQPPGTAREYQHAVGQEYRLVDLVGDKQHSLAALLPDAQQLGLHDLAGLRVPDSWDGEPIDIGGAGREYLVLSQGAWSCQRAVRFGDHLYLRTWHDGYHPHWEPEMLFDIRHDPHETTDLFVEQRAVASDAARRLDEWTRTQLERAGGEDPMDVVRREGGPFHVRRHLRPYLDRLRATGRGHWADVLAERHEAELVESTDRPRGTSSA